MRPLLLIVAACAALLYAPIAEARQVCDAQLQVIAPPVVTYYAVTQPVVTQPVAVSYRQGTRRLNLRERIKARRASVKAIRAARLSTVEAVVEPQVVPAGVVSGLEDNRTSPR